MWNKKQQKPSDKLFFLNSKRKFCLFVSRHRLITLKFFIDPTLSIYKFVRRKKTFSSNHCPILGLSCVRVCAFAVLICSLKLSPSRSLKWLLGYYKVLFFSLLKLSKLSKVSKKTSLIIFFLFFTSQNQRKKKMNLCVFQKFSRVVINYFFAFFQDYQKNNVIGNDKKEITV
jgi:hypothetical protein